MNDIKFILMDIEGTTTSIDFVHQELFPYSFSRMESFINAHPEIEIKENAETLKQWIKEDKKEPELKRVQGLIWQEGYEKGEIKGHIYDDVPDAFKLWKKNGFTLGIYSSGSVLAQRLLFRFSSKGDLTPYLSAHFDTQVGAKREIQSYIKIADQLHIKPSQILFLSDIFEELEAADKAGFHVAQLIRKDNVIIGRFQTLNSFLELKEII